MMPLLILTAAAYLIGSIPFGVIVMRLATGRDIRQEGSGNIGAANVYRVTGLRLGIVVLALDLAKGAIAVVLAQRVMPQPVAAVVAGIAVVVGHNWSVFLRGQGGKGIATSYGVLLALSPVAGGVAAAIWIVVVALTRYASAGSLTGVLSVPLVMWLSQEPVEHLVFGVAAVVFAFYRHRANIRRLLRGEELKLGHHSSAGAHAVKDTHA